MVFKLAFCYSTKKLCLLYIYLSAVQPLTIKMNQMCSVDLDKAYDRETVRSGRGVCEDGAGHLQGP